MRRISGANTRNGMTYSQARCHDSAMVGYFEPQAPSANLSCRLFAGGRVDRAQCCDGRLTVPVTGVLEIQNIGTVFPISPCWRCWILKRTGFSSTLRFRKCSFMQKCDATFTERARTRMAFVWNIPVGRYAQKEKCNTMQFPGNWRRKTCIPRFFVELE